MKTLLTFFVLFFSSSVFARIILIDCGEDKSYKIDSKNKVWIKDRRTDYKWKDNQGEELITDNGDEIVLGAEDKWEHKKTGIKYNRLRISIPNKTGVASYFYFYNSKDFSIETIETNAYCSYKKT